jgi:hypothetical protein
MELNKFIFYFGTAVIAITFILALLHIKTKKPAYFKYIFCYVVLGLLISLSNFLFIIEYLPSNNLILVSQTILTSFQTLCFCLAFLSERIIKKSILIILFILFVMLESFLIKWICFDVKPPSYYVSLEAAVFQGFILIFSITYFKRLLHSLPTKKLKYDPFFWIAVGILFYSACSFPISTLLPFLDYKIPDNLLYQIFSISNMSLIVLYLFICKAYLCLKHQVN